jgi:serum/glucocorticoid-regulated kinase 2
MDPKKRLGYQTIKDIKNHPFFKGINFEKIMEMDAPFKPLGRD